MRMTIGARAAAFAVLAAFAPAVAAAQYATAEENSRTVHAFLSGVDVGAVQMSALAQKRAANAEVKAFAAAMLAGHTGALHHREAQVISEGQALFAAQMGHAPAAGGDAHTGHGAAGAAPLSAEQLQALQAALEQHPTSRILAEASAHNLGVLQAVTAASFDATYMDAQIALHRHALAVLDRMMSAGGVTLAMMEIMLDTRGAVGQHLEQAQAIRGRL